MKVKIKYKDEEDMRKNTSYKSYYISSIYHVENLDELYTIQKAMIDLHHLRS